MHICTEYKAGTSSKRCAFKYALAAPNRSYIWVPLSAKPFLKAVPDAILNICLLS